MKKFAFRMQLGVCHPELVSGSNPCCEPHGMNIGELPAFAGMTRIAFTMAEILLSLTIIGVVAAITLPSLTGNINERTWNTQRKALYSRMSQAIAMLPSLSGYGIAPENEINTANNVARAFVTDGLGKVLKINHICDNNHFKDCGIQGKYKTLDGSKKNFPTTMRELHSSLAGSISHTAFGSISLINTNSVAFETESGESVAVFYQPNCRYFIEEGFFQTCLCANFIVDLNGKKGPNTVYKDIWFMSAFYPTDSVLVMPEVNNIDSATHQTVSNAINICRNTGNLRLPNKEELASVLSNQNILGQNINPNGIYMDKDKKAMPASWFYYAKATYWQGGLSVRCLKR